MPLRYWSGAPDLPCALEERESNDGRMYGHSFVDNVYSHQDAVEQLKEALNLMISAFTALEGALLAVESLNGELEQLGELLEGA